MIPPLVLFPLAFFAVCVPSARIGEVRILPWLVLYVLATALAVTAGAVTAVGLVELVVLFGVAWDAHRVTGRLRGLLLLLYAVLALAVSLQVLPGIGKLTWPSPVQLTPHSSAFLPSINVGKVSAGLLLFALLVPRIESAEEIRRLWKPTLAIGIVGVAITSCTAVAIGYVRFEPKLPPGTLAFLVSNLLFTCVAEESFFRGLLQEEMHRAAERSGRRGLQAGVVVVSALLFGVAHASGGVHLVLLATLGGLTNALAYARARKVEASILTHFLLNAVHFVFLTYPGLVH